MEVSVAQAKNQLPKLLRAVEGGDEIVITRRGKRVARLTSVPPEKRKVQFGTMRGKIHLKPGWDKPITEEEFLRGKW
ncbi:MAG: type II toxin-antitoxin system Phd/YefM family antitoxin [Terriglobales bacterium]